MAITDITVKSCTCERCSHKWIPKQASAEDITVCPRCKSPYWNRKKEYALFKRYETFRNTVLRRVVVKQENLMEVVDEFSTSMAADPRMSEWVKMLLKDKHVKELMG